ncbi:Cache 3/Cache 2 fusion domain-containing protein [Pectobacterium cacticida]|uniref:methyl-accepting chemotaxis protein n=1 Tax=Pectobacterium cacticida TaxID=69221 RepID=UPI002FF06385
MLGFSFKHWGLGIKLSIIASLSVAILFIAFTLSLTRSAGHQLNTLTLNDMQSQVSGVADMVNMYDTGLQAEVSNYTRLMASFLPTRFYLDTVNRTPFDQTSHPTLKAGDTVLNLNTIVPDDFLSRTQALSTIFVRDGDDFTRITTSLRKEDGTRALGTQLDRASPAYALMIKGQTYSGLATLFGKQYITQYQPIRDSNNTVIGIMFVGVDITKQFTLMQQRILAKKIGENGHFFVISSKPGEERGRYLFHNDTLNKKALVNQQPNWSEGALEQVLTTASGTLEYDDNALPETQRTQVMVYRSIPQWNWVIVGTISKNSLLSAVNHTRNLFLAGGIILVVLFAAFFFTLTRKWLSQPLEKIVRVAEQFSAGNLTVTLSTDRTDEVGRLIDAMNGIGQGLTTIVSQVRSASEEISASTDALAADSENISGQIARQASSVEETSASMEQLSASVKQNADNVSAAKALAEQSAMAARNGSQTVTDSVSTMSDIKNSSQRIADITTVIESIAFQTNILALNAAVEAARAGEHGRGFAVVAAEVRALAQRSATAVKEIETLINESLEKIEAGYHFSEKTQAVMDDVRNRILQVSTIVNDIDIASREQSAGIDQVNTAMVQISQATQENTLLVNNSENTAQNLRQKGHHLSELVGVFRI